MFNMHERVTGRFPRTKLMFTSCWNVWNNYEFTKKFVTGNVKWGLMTILETGSEWGQGCFWLDRNSSANRPVNVCHWLTDWWSYTNVKVSPFAVALSEWLGTNNAAHSKFIAHQVECPFNKLTTVLHTQIQFSHIPLLCVKKVVRVSMCDWPPCTPSRG